MSPPPHRRDDFDPEDEFSDFPDEGLESEESEGCSEDREVSPCLIRHSWPDILDEGTESSPSAERRAPSALKRRRLAEVTVAARVKDGSMESECRMPVASTAGSQDADIKSKAMSMSPSIGGSALRGASTVAHAAASSSSGQADRVAAMKAAASVASAALPEQLAATVLFPSSSSSSSSSAFPAPSSQTRKRQMPDSEDAEGPSAPSRPDHRPWRRDASSSRSADTRRKKRRGHREAPPIRKERRKLQQQDPIQVPDLQSMSPAEMNDYIRWWRKMHLLTWKGFQQPSEHGSPQLPIAPPRGPFD